MYNYVDICGQIDELLSEKVCRQIRELSKYSEPIVLFIDTEGGCTSCLQRIVNEMIDCSIPIYGCVIGKAYSAGFDILMFCQKRYANPDAKFLFHWAVLCNDTAQAISASFGEPAFAPEEEFDTDVFERLAKLLNKTTDEVRVMAREEKSWTAQDALKAGIVDFVYPENL